ncbi:Protein U5 [Human herpesvirus 7 strain JI] [Rhizoctonia solani]|uniref:Protein U5 [Human herpesvirus 7 strain JI] n=1 Tax=Rhizoctonia solani TaxID=456999 RepID=A0A0K6GEP9_9AGAM|nr:Protein U5 [Human herpesvirus 7 strain JI] [Rhizoctonia solani]
MGTTIQQWEEAGASLVTALTKYLDLSLLLEQNALLEDNSGKDLAMRIDSALSSLQTVVDSHMSRVRSALARTRNRILSPIHRLPREVLSGIFMNAIFAAPDLSKPEPVEDSVARIYLTLHNILGVCEKWRDIALTQGSFWSIVPVLDFPSRTRAGKIKQANAVLLRSILRANLKGHLHLVVAQPCDSSYIEVLGALAVSFRAANISAGSRSSLRRTLDIFLSQGFPEDLALSQLSIHQKQDDSYLYKLPKVKNYVLSNNSPEQAVFEKLSQNLSSLRIRGAQFHWARFSFANRLTELYLQEVLFGHELGHFFQAIASASELRVLELVSIVSFYDGPPVYTTPEQSEIHLSNLQTLVIKDLYFNTLDQILCSITSRSHSLSLFLTEKCRYADTAGLDSDFVDVHWESLYELLRQVQVKDLLLTNNVTDHWLPSSRMEELLKSTISGLQTLQLHLWDFSTAYCNVLTSYSLSDDSLSCKISNLHITCARVHDRGAFTDMVLSHSNSIRKMVFGGLIRSVRGDSFDRVLDHESVVFIMKSSVRKFQLYEVTKFKNVDRAPTPQVTGDELISN